MSADSGNRLEWVKRKLGSFALMQVAFYVANGMFLPYRVVFLAERGVPSGTIGFILTLNSVATIFAQPMWGILCDKLGSIRKIFVLCLLVCMVLVPSLTLANSILAYTILLTVIAVFICPFFPLLDAWTMQGIKSMAGNPSYGSIRKWGSISFAPAMLIMGYVIRETSINTAMITYSILNLFTLAVALCIPIDGVPAKRPANKGEKTKSGNAAELFKNKKYITYIICYCLVNIAAMAQISFAPQRVAHAGGDTFIYGIMVAYGALCEVPMYQLSPWLMRKIKPVMLIMTAMLLTSLHMLALSSNIPLPGIVILQAMRGLAYGLYLVGNVYYVDSLAPDHLKASAQSIAVTFSAGIAGMIGSGLGGIMIDKTGILTTHLVGAAFSMFSFVLFGLTFFGGNLMNRMRRRKDV